MNPGFSDQTFDFAQGSVTGIRVWNFTSYVLSNNLGIRDAWNGVVTGMQGIYWTENEKSAGCLVPPEAFGDSAVPHYAPDPECTCGIYASWASEQYYNYENLPATVSGIIEGYGRTIVGSKGFRTQHARIKALCYSYKEPHYEYVSTLVKSEIRSILANRFEVSVYSNIDFMLANHPLTTEYLPAEDINSIADATVHDPNH